MGAVELEVTQLGRYKILKHLATGGMAEVYLATAMGIEGFERHVVIKCIHKQHAKNEAFVKMFLDEARLAASLHHHNIVQVHDIGQEDGEYFYAMEYVHGEDLRGLLRNVSIRKDKVPIEHAITIVTAAAAGLHHAHEARGSDRRPLGLVHRDVSPSNIIVDYDGNVKVVDFGIAKAALRTEQTKSGVLKGKIAYMSPEQCRGKPVDRRSDVYALGIVLYEVITARRLFKGDNDFMTMSVIVAGKIPPPSLRRPDLPPALEAIILKALARDPQDRYATALDMRKALEDFAATAGLRTSSAALGDYMTELFGHRPEPWLLDAAVPPEDLSVDFDGNASGLAAVSQSAIEDFVNQGSQAQSSPLMKARRKKKKPVRMTGPMMAEEMDDDDNDVELDYVEEPRSPTGSGSGTPMAWQAPAFPETRSRRSWVIAVVAIPLVIAGVVLGPRLLTRNDATQARGAAGGAEESTEPVKRMEPTPASGDSTPTTPPTTTEPTKATAKPTPSTLGEPASAASSAEPATSGDQTTATAKPTTSAATTTANPTTPVATKRPVKRPKPATKGATKGATKQPDKTDPNWDPDTLLPE